MNSPARRPRLMWWLIIVVVVGACSIVRSSLSGHEALLGELDDIALPPGLTLIVDREVGPSECFAGDCPAVDRYYASSAPPDKMCAQVSELAASLGLAQRDAEQGCLYSGSLESGSRLDIRVSSPQEEIAAYGNTVLATPVEVPHEAILLLAIS